jgi:hypothetical protein
VTTEEAELARLDREIAALFEGTPLPLSTHPQAIYQRQYYQRNRDKLCAYSRLKHQEYRDARRKRSKQ